MINKDRLYITCKILPDGTIAPMGNAKPIKYARKIAKLHKHGLFELTLIEDYSQDAEQTMNENYEAGQRSMIKKMDELVKACNEVISNYNKLKIKINAKEQNI